MKSVGQSLTDDELKKVLELDDDFEDDFGGINPYKGYKFGVPPSPKWIFRLNIGFNKLKRFFKRR